MTLTITHNKVATLPDQPGAEVNKGEWNDTHAIAGDLSGYTFTTSQISDATIASASSVSGTNTGDQNLAPYLLSATAASTYVPQTTTVNGQALSGNITITNITGNAATVTTNANLTGVITSVGNATSIASQTGTGTKFVVDTSPTLVTPNIGTATGTGLILTSTSATSFAVGANGSTNAALTVDASTASSATGISIKSAAAGNSATIIATSSNSTESLVLSTKGDANLVYRVAGTSNAHVFQLNAVTRFQVKDAQTTFTPDFVGGGSTSHFLYTGPSDITLATTVEATSVYFNMGQTRQHATGTLALQRDFRVTGSTHSFVGASTLTNAAAFSVDGPISAGTNSTITNSYGIYVPTLAVSGTVNNAYGAFFAAPSAAGTTNAAIGTTDATHTVNLSDGTNAITASGNISLTTAGNGLIIKSGSNSRIGTGTLTAGTVTIANTSVTANTRVFLQDTTSGGLTNVGVLTAVTTAGTGFVVTSTLALDTSTFNWLLVESA